METLPSVKTTSPLALQHTKSKLFVDGEECSVGKQISKIGFGVYQAQAFIFCCGSIWCEGTQLSTIAGIKVPIYKEFHITSALSKSLLVTILYVGFAVGTIASGPLGDTKGRRVPMMVGYMGIVFCQVLMYMGPWLPWLYTMVFLLGVFSGIGIPAAVTSMGEVSPEHLRGLLSAALCFGFSCGELWTALGLRLFVPNLLVGAWRFQLLWAGIPPVLLLLLGLFCRVTSYDSPQFLAVNNRQAELRGVLNLIAEMNGQPELALKADLPSEAGETDVSFVEVLRIMGSGWMPLYSFVLSALFFAYNFSYYGTTDFWPIGWEGMHLQGVDKATEMIYTALIGFAGVPVAMFTMSWIDRRVGLCIAAVLCFIATICLQGLLTDKIIEGWTGVILFKLFWMTFQMITMVIPGELYPTRIGVWAWSIVCFFGRIGCILAPIVISFTSKGFLIILACLLAVSGFLVWLLPETRDVNKEELDDELAKEERDLEVQSKLASANFGKAYGSFGPSQRLSSV